MGGLVEYEVTKAIIVVVGTSAGSANRYLMSIKRDPGSPNDGKLEFLGGRMEAGEDPVSGIVRELSEEEATGNLAKIVRRRTPIHIPQHILNSRHYLFPLQITDVEFHSLEYHPLESYGFRLVGSHKLQRCDDSYTRKTNHIIDLLDLPVVKAAS